MRAADYIAERLHRVRRFVRGHWLLLPLTLLLVYFAYHALHGRRGLIAWMDLRRELETAKQELATLDAERRSLEARVRALEPGRVDADALEGELRRLGYVRPDELVVLVEPLGDGRETAPGDDR